MDVDLKKLFTKLNASCRSALEGASGICLKRAHYEVDIIHLILHLLEQPNTDFSLVLTNNNINKEKWKKTLIHELELIRGGNPGRPVFSDRLISCIEDAWVYSSLDIGIDQIRTSSILGAISDNAYKSGVEDLEGISDITSENIKMHFWDIAQLSDEGAPHEQILNKNKVQHISSHEETHLSKYTTNFSQRARDGLIDPVFGRDREIRQIIDILARRRKNNPITVGDAGVGKTAIVEGLALKLIEGDVPDVIKGVDILGLDLGLLQAGASVKGEFENRLNTIIKEIKTSTKPIILFIDEAHTLIGAGGAAGTNDAANILKPALARGELRTIAATTWSEYKKYFEKDAALERRFQLVKLDEPTIEQTQVILRGLKHIYERSHGVYIRDEAIVAVATLSARYITGRQLPDKAIDVLDTACARVKISLGSKPSIIEDLERQISILNRERESLGRDVKTKRVNDDTRIKLIDTQLKSIEEISKQKVAKWETELTAVKKLIELRDLNHKNSEITNEDTLNDKLSSAINELEVLQDDNGLITYEVTADVVSKIISDWTGIPINRLVKDEIKSIFTLRDTIKTVIRGQDHAIDLIDSCLRSAKAGLNNPEQPLGVFLLVGPSGVGKTETAIGIAKHMFGGERFMTTINMSEYQEKHTVSRLIGSSAGYVGYGQGGVLTEAIRQRPYSVLLLDEVEKADIEVVNLFYQVFDKGTLTDGEGRVIDFKNTVIILTTNLASQTITDLFDENSAPTFEETVEAIRPELKNHFKSALLARMTVIPYYPINHTVLQEIIITKLESLSSRIMESQRLTLRYDDDLVRVITKNCNDLDSGARNVDHIINKSLLPLISTEILQITGVQHNAKILKISHDNNDDYVVTLH